MEKGECMAPSDLCNFQSSYQFQGPGCLCPLRDHGEPAFIESAIFCVVEGDFIGEYVACCARDRCGYYGQLLYTLFQGLD